MLIHFVFDLLAILSGIFISLWFQHKYKLKTPIGISLSQYHYYLLALLVGLILGSVSLGTLNFYLSGFKGVAKSMLGGVLGAVIAAESFKYFAGLRQSTGLFFVPALIMLIVIGRIGCFLTGLDDFTYGVETNLPWAIDFGDGIKRHPVQLYESLSMLIFLFILLISYPLRSKFWQQQGFYIFILAYAGQRFSWEFIKPYPTILGSLNVFHIASLSLIAYALWMLLKAKKA